MPNRLVKKVFVWVLVVLLIAGVVLSVLLPFLY